MKKVLIASAILALLAVGALWIGCGSNACEEIADKCAECEDATFKAACDAATKPLVDADDSDACQQWIDAFDTWIGAYPACKA
jgi:hypothetical protein